MNRLPRALRVARHSRNAILAGCIAVLIAAATVLGVSRGGRGGTDSVPVPVTRRTLTTVVALQGTVETLPGTPLTGLTSGSEVEWLVEDGAPVKTGDALYRELRVKDPAELENLRRQEKVAIEEVKKAEQAPTPTPSPTPTPVVAQDALARANEARAEAVRRLEAVEAEGDAAVAAAERRLADARAYGTEADIQAATEGLEGAVAERLGRVNEVRAQVNTATDEIERALAGRQPSPIPAPDPQRRLAELRRAAADLTAKVRRAESGIAQGMAEQDGVVRIVTSRVPAGNTEADRVIGRLEPPGFVVSARVGPPEIFQMPEVIGAAAVRLPGGPSEFACDRTKREEAEGNEAVVRCFLSPGPQLKAGQKAELQVAVEELVDALVVPASAVETTSATTGVVTRTVAGRSHETEIYTLGSDGEFVAVREGLLENEMVLDPKPGS